MIENTPSAFAAAIAGHYAIELDLQISADGEAVVHHDGELGRLTDGAGRLDAMSVAELKRVPFKATADRIITLGELLDLVASRATLVIELKSRSDGDRRLALRAAELIAGYRGPAALMSFDPFQVELVRQAAPALTRGIIAERHYAPAPDARAGAERSLAYLSHLWRARPQFVAYAVNDLPALPPWLARSVLGLPLLTWTVRTAQDRQRAARWADQMIFEGWRA